MTSPEPVSSREYLARECERDGAKWLATRIRAGERLGENMETAIKAMDAAIASTREECAQALKPFAEVADWIDANRPDYNKTGREVQIEGWPYSLSVSWFQQARAAIRAGGEG